MLEVLLRSMFHTTILPVLLLATALACGGHNQDSSKVPVGKASFAVMSDTHVHDTATLGASGAEFEAYLAQDRKMIVESQETLDATLTDLKTQKLDFLLITGDLTKDGEKVNHQLMASKLAQVRALGTKVFVIPGNHDVFIRKGF